MNSVSHTLYVLLPALTLCSRELVRFYRQPSRVIGVIGSPLIFWFLIGSGLGSSFRHPNSPAATNYLEYFYPGTIILIMLFTSIFSTISIIEDRREGFLQSVLVAPVSRASIVLGKILGGTLLSLLQAVVLLLLAPFVGISFSLVSVLVVVLALFLVGFGLTGLGFFIAWRMDSTQGFHAVMNLFLIPLWLLSGALFPASGAATWLKTLMAWNPLTYCVAALRQGLYLNSGDGIPELVSLHGALLVISIFAVFTFFICTSTVQKRPAV